MIYKDFAQTFKNQQGAALPMVLILMILMFILSVAAYQVSQGNTGIIAVASTSEKAFYAAEQGYNRTLWRLNNEKDNFLIIEDNSPELIQYGDKEYNLYELEPGPNYRINVLVPLVEIEGQTDKVEDNNLRVIRSTGWDKSHPERLRTIEVEVYKKTFTQFVMANDKEEDKSGNPIYWLSGEAVYGPLHTNHILYVRGKPVFYGPVTYVRGINITPTENLYNPAIFRKGNSQVAETLAFSSSLNNLKAYARIDGHYYNGGRATIHLLGDGGYNIRRCEWNNDPNQVRWYYNDAEYRFRPTKDGNPPNLLQTNLWWDWEIAAEKANSSSDVMFQKIFRNSDGSIDNSQTQNFSSFADFANTVSPMELPANGVIYVDGRTGTNNANGVNKFHAGLGNIFVSGKLDGRLTIAAANDIYITAHNPCDWHRPEWDNSWYDSTPGVTYQNTGFNQVFENDEWLFTEVTGNGDDMLGLVATNFVNVLHFNWLSQHDRDVRFRGSIGDLFTYRDYCWTFLNTSLLPIDNAPKNINIHAAIYSQNESFGFEAHDASIIISKDNANLVGSIAQKYRGPLGISGIILSGGYKKHYTHDPRFLYDSPPHFPNPANSGWESSRWNEIKDHIL